jgi:hypothetical protein
VEQRFRTASQKRDLASDAAFTGKLKDILAKGNASSAQLLADHCDFLLLCDMGDAVKASMGKMPATVKNSATGLRMQDAYYSQCPAPAVGSYAPDFTLPTPDGKTIHFYDFIKDKKCVLLDFWACGVCGAAKKIQRSRLFTINTAIKVLLSSASRLTTKNPHGARRLPKTLPPGPKLGRSAAQKPDSMLGTALTAYQLSSSSAQMGKLWPQGYVATR